MNELKIIPDTLNKSYENPELLDCYPDIDYEMLPIKDDDNGGTGQANHFYDKQLSSQSMKNMLKEAEEFDLVDRDKNNLGGSRIVDFNNEMNYKCIAISQKSDIIIFLPIEQINECRKTKKYTKIFLQEDQVLKTSINFKQLKKCLLRYGFKEYQKSRLVRNKLKLRFPNLVNPL